MKSIEIFKAFSVTTLQNGNELIQSTKYEESLCKDVTKAWLAGSLCDVELISAIDDTRIRAHKLVLAASSEYFFAMFNSSMRESRTDNVTLGEINGNTLKDLVNYCYTGTITLSESTIETILKSASLLQFTKIVSICSEFIGQRLHISNCLGIYCIAEQLNAIDLLQKSDNFIKKHILEVSVVVEFLELDVEHLKQFVKSEDINVTSEEDVFNIILSWLNHKVEQREQHKADLLSLVRLTQLKPSFILEKVEPECVSLEFKKMILDALKWHHLPKLRSILPCANPRSTLLRSIVLIGAMETNLVIISYCTTAEEWTVWPEQFQFRSYYAFTVMDDKLIILGGYKRKTLNNEVDVYQTKSVQYLNTNTMTIGRLPVLNEIRFGLCAAVVGNYLYAMGGKNEVEYSNSVERYDPAESTWKYVASMNSKRSFFAAGVIKDKIYVFGGYDSFKNLIYSTECYDPETDKWSTCANMNKACSNISGTVAQNMLYAIGSCIDCRCHMECYNPEKDKWTTLYSLADGPTFVNLTAVNNELWAITSPGTTELNALNKYDPEENKWSEVKKLPLDLSAALVVSVPNKQLRKLSAEEEED